MRCSDVQQKLDLFVTQELAHAVRERIEAHLESCDECREALARVRRFEDLLTSAPAPPVPDGFAARVVAQAKERQAIAVHSESMPRVPVWSVWKRFEFSPGAAAALAAGLMVGVFLGHETWQTAVQHPPAPSTQSADVLLASGFDLVGGSRGDSLAEAYLQLTSDRDR
jgi:anti-sigma factor RsiW